MFDIGILDSPQIVEVQRSDLVSNFIGDTAKKTTEWVKKSFGKLLFVDEAYTLYSKSKKDFGKEAVETIMRCMLPSETLSEYHPIFVFCGYEGSMHEFLNLNKGLRRRIKQYFKFADYSPAQLSSILFSKLMKEKIRFPYGLKNIVADCFGKISKKIRSEHNASLCEDLVREIRYNQQNRLSFGSSLNEMMRYENDDFEEGMRVFLSKIDTKTNTKDKETQTPSDEVFLHINGVGIVPASPWA